jgi:hypothetical protein
MTILRTLVVLSAVVFFTASAAQCGQPCPYGNNDCTDPSCSRCNGTNGFGGVCVPGNSCSTKCSANTDCDQTSQCKQCWQGVCTAGCFMPCTNDTFCGAPGCNRCIAGVCQLSSCAQQCTADTDCKFGSCISCVGGRCRGKCGVACTQNDDCGASAKCSVCLAGKCAANTTRLH